MAFDKDKFKKNIQQEKEKTDDKIKKFIDEFTEKVESEEFEDWLQTQLEYTNKKYKELSFYIGINYKEAKNRWEDISPYYFCISGEEYFIDDNIVNIQFGHYFMALDDYEKEQDDYYNAMDECWAKLMQKLKSLGLTITSPSPKWIIGYKINSIKVEVDFIE